MKEPEVFKFEIACKGMWSMEHFVLKSDYDALVSELEAMKLAYDKAIQAGQVCMDKFHNGSDVKDAERYRWLKDRKWRSDPHLLGGSHLYCSVPDEFSLMDFESAIDAAIEADRAANIYGDEK